MTQAVRYGCEALPTKGTVPFLGTGFQTQTSWQQKGPSPSWANGGHEAECEQRHHEQMSQSNTDEPRVAIVMTTYNGERYVCAQIESIRAQTYTNWTLLVSDDGSSDQTRSLLETYADLDDRVRVIRNAKPFGSAQRHFMALAKKVTPDYEYVLFCDQDDVWDSDKVEVEVSEARRFEERYGADRPLLVCTDLRVVDEGLALIDRSFMSFSNFPSKAPSFNYLLIENMVVGCTMLLNKSLLAYVKRTPDDTFICMHDRWIALLASGFGSVVFIDCPTVSYRQHDTNSVGAARFSVGKNLHKDAWEKQCTMMRDSIEQARSLKRCFGRELPEERRRSLEHFCALRCHPRIRRVYHLLAAKAWKTGAPRRIAEAWGILTSKWI